MACKLTSLAATAMTLLAGVASVEAASAQFVDILPHMLVGGIAATAAMVRLAIGLVAGGAVRFSAPLRMADRAMSFLASDARDQHHRLSRNPAVAVLEEWLCVSVLIAGAATLGFGTTWDLLYDLLHLLHELSGLGSVVLFLLLPLAASRGLPQVPADPGCDCRRT